MQGLRGQTLSFHVLFEALVDNTAPQLIRIKLSDRVCFGHALVGLRGLD